MEYSMQYKVKFMDGFDWTRGGKLPGLCGGGARHAPHPCTAVSIHTGLDGFSVLSWVVAADGAPAILQTAAAAAASAPWAAPR